MSVSRCLAALFGGVWPRCLAVFGLCLVVLIMHRSSELSATRDYILLLSGSPCLALEAIIHGLNKTLITH